MISSIPFILAGGPFIGYLIAEGLDRTFQCGLYVKLLIILLFTAASIRETARLIRQIPGSNKNPG